MVAAGIGAVGEFVAWMERSVIQGGGGFEYPGFRKLHPGYLLLTQSTKLVDHSYSN
jgi:hypothetical protein